MLVLHDIYWLTCYENEAAMKLGWKTTRMQGGVYVFRVIARCHNSVHDFVSFGDQSANAEKVITSHTKHQGLILVCISYWQMGNTFAR